MSKIIPLVVPEHNIEIIDQSVFQDYTAGNKFQPVDYVKAKATRPTLRQIIIKAGEGFWDGYLITDFMRQWDGALSGGWENPVPYHFHHSEFGVTEQATYFHNRVKNLNAKMYMMDCEDVDSDGNRPPGHYNYPGGIVPQAEYPQWIKKALNYASALRNYQDAMAQKFGYMGLWYGAAWCEDWWMDFAAMGGMKMDWIHIPPRLIASYTPSKIHVPNLCDPSKIVACQHTSTPASGVGPGRQVNGYGWPEKLDLSFWVKSEPEFVDFFNGDDIIIPNPLPVDTHQALWDTIWIQQAHIELAESSIAELQAWKEKMKNANI